jgi:hypothetical protein
VEQGVLEKRRYQDRPARYEYHLIDKGYDAARLLVAMMGFGETWLFAPGHEPVHLFNRRTGRRVRPLTIDAESGMPIEVRELYAGPGPSFPPVEQIRRERFAEYYERRGEAHRV